MMKCLKAQFPHHKIQLMYDIACTLDKHIKVCECIGICTSILLCMCIDRKMRGVILTWQSLCFTVMGTSFNARLMKCMMYSNCMVLVRNGRFSMDPETRRALD